MSFIAIDREFVPLPDGITVGDNDFFSRNTRVVGLSDDGEVLIRNHENTAITERAFVWRGSGEPELIPNPSGIERMRVSCLLSGDRSIIGLPELSSTGGYIYESLLPMMVEGGTATQLVNPDGQYFDVLRCNDAGQVLTSNNRVLGSGPPLEIDPLASENLGFNDMGMALFANGFWDGTELRPFVADFKPYSGPTNKAVLFGSFEEIKRMDDTPAALLNTEDDSLTLIPRIPESQEVPEPIMIGPEGDVVVGIGIFSEEPNAMYLYRKGKFSILGTEDVDVGAVVQINAKGQVLVETLRADVAEGHIGILFTPRN